MLREWRMMVVWACFALRLLFYAAMLPLWEGYDEWAHFAVIRQMAAGGHLLVSRQAPLPRDVEASLQLAPVPWEMRSVPPPSVTQDVYWGLDRAERDRRNSALRTTPAQWGREDGAGSLTAYEALQPPLYYWLMTPAVWLCQGLGIGLLGQVWAVRVLSVLLASLVVPLVFFVARQVWRQGPAAAGCAAIVAVMPGLALDVARVGNDCLAVVLFTALTWLLVKISQQGLSLKLAVGTGVILALGLLTKAYFLTALPAVLLVLAYAWRRGASILRALLPGAISLLLAGWWYLQNLRTTGTLTGLSESVMLRGVSSAEMLRQAARINWVKAVDAIFLSHLYFGGWSSLTVRSWMYHLFYLLILAGAIGLARSLRLPAIRTLLLFYLAFWLGQLYNVVLLYMSKGLAGSMGWYMYAVVAAEVVLCVAGLRNLLPAKAARWIAPCGALLFALLDLYTVHAVAIPYYTGMIRHRPNGSLAALHGAGFHSVGFTVALDRLAVLVPAPLWTALWLLYLSGTVAALACAVGLVPSSRKLP